MKPAEFASVHIDESRFALSDDLIEKREKSFDWARAHIEELASTFMKGANSDTCLVLDMRSPLGKMPRVLRLQSSAVMPMSDCKSYFHHKLQFMKQDASAYSKMLLSLDSRAAPCRSKRGVMKWLIIAFGDIPGSGLGTHAMTMLPWQSFCSSTSEVLASAQAERSRG